MFVNVDPDAVIRSAFELPALPQSTVRLANVIANIDVELSEVVQVIEFDPALTLKLLRVANSVYSSSSRRIGTVKDAVIRLGAGAVLGLAIGACVRPNIVKVIPGYNLEGTYFWRHSLAAALATESLRAYSKNQVSSLAFTAAMLHDIGKLVLGNFLNAETLEYLERARREGKIMATRAETEILSMNHGEVGGVVAQHWGLPESVVKGIAFHHNPESCDDPIGYVTHFANFVAHEIVPDVPFGTDEEQAVEREGITNDLKQLGLDAEKTDKICQAVRERLKAVDADFA